MSALEAAAERFAAGEAVLVCGLHGAGATVATAAARVSTPRLEQLQRLGGDMIVLGLEAPIARRLRLSTPAQAGRRRPGLRLAIPVDVDDCLGGGWSTAERAHTIRVAADPVTRPGDLTVPGHVHAAHVDGSATTAAGAALELARITDQPAAVVLSAVLDRCGRPVSLGRALSERRLRALPVAPAEELCASSIVHQAARSGMPGWASCELPTRLGRFEVRASVETDDGELTVTLTHGDPAARARPIVRTHVACVLGDTFGSLLCECRARLERAVGEIVEEGCGILVYVKPAVEDPFTCPRAA